MIALDDEAGRLVRYLNENPQIEATYPTLGKVRDCFIAEDGARRMAESGLRALLAMAERVDKVLHYKCPVWEVLAVCQDWQKALEVARVSVHE